MVTKEPKADTMVPPKLLTLRKQHLRPVASNTKVNAGWRKVVTPDAMAQIATPIISTKSKRIISEKANSDSKSKSSTVEWKKSVNWVQQMYITQQYWADNGMDSDKEITSIEGDQLKHLHKKAKQAENALKQNWETYTVQRVGSKQRKVPK